MTLPFHIIVYGKLFSGVDTVANAIVKNGDDFAKIDMNYIIDSFYNDFAMIQAHNNRNVRQMIKTSLIIKNSSFLYRTIGIPEYISASMMYEWLKLFDNNLTPAQIKSRIYLDMYKLQPLWRKIFVREKMVVSKHQNYVITHAFSKHDFQVVQDAVKIFVDCSDTNRYKHGFMSSSLKMTYQDIFQNVVDANTDELKKKADFILDNNWDKKVLTKQVCDLLKLLKLQKKEGYTYGNEHGKL